MQAAPIRVAIVDDHQLLLQGLVAHFSAHKEEFEVVCSAADAEEGLRQVLIEKPDVLILDVELPGRGSFEFANELRTRLKTTRVLFLSGFLSDVFIEQALRLKSYGYLMKGEPIAFLLEAVRRVAAGQQCFSKEVEARLDYDASRKRHVLHATSHLSALTSRQLEVLRHLARGESVKEVAKTMHLSQKSVDSHKYRIMHKLGIHDRVQLARYAIREGLMLP